jgi:hypothetical protein
MRGITGITINNTSKQQRPEEIHELLDHALPGGFRRGAKDQQGMAEQFVEARAGNLRSKKIGDQPRFDAFEFAGFDGVFDLLEIGVPRADDHAVRRMLVQHLREFLQRGFAEAQFRHNFNAFVRLLLQFAPQPGDFAAGGDEDKPAFVLIAGRICCSKPTRQFLFQINQAETDAEKNHHPRGVTQSERHTSPSPGRWW